MQNKPGYSLDHIVKERIDLEFRYPSFIDALIDLDDVLSLVFLFASLPADQKRVHSNNTNTCKRLAAEFQRYIVYSRCLLKTFLSIKDAGLSYPPKIDLEKDSGSAGLNFFTLHSEDGQVFTDQAMIGLETNPVKSLNDLDRNEMEKRLLLLKDKLAAIVEHDANESAKDQATNLSNSIVFEKFSKDEAATKINDVATLDEMFATKESTQRQNLFSRCVFWLSREVPRWSLEFVIRSCGGVCGWDISSGVGSPISEDSSRITHHIGQLKNHERRKYIQPQWIYDCVNVGKLLSAKGYHQGETLPPHLSPFVSLDDGSYVPEEAYKLLRRQEDDFAEEAEEEADETVENIKNTKKEKKVSQRKKLQNVD
ncbi:mRNA-binding ribosome synthesis protein nop7, partial [Nowakowskiella sp. JEL0078]